MRSSVSSQSDPDVRLCLSPFRIRASERDKQRHILLQFPTSISSKSTADREGPKQDVGDITTGHAFAIQVRLAAFVWPGLLMSMHHDMRTD